MSLLCIHHHSLSTDERRRKFCLGSKRVNQTTVTSALPALLRDFTLEQIIASTTENWLHLPPSLYTHSRRLAILVL